MSSVTLEKILDDIKALTPEEQRQLRELLNREMATAEQPQKDALLRRIQGKYAHLPTSSEEFAARKQEEIALEDRHRFDKEETEK